MERSLHSPFTREAVETLNAGDRVLVSGTVYTGRDRAHKFLGEGGTAPESLADAAIFHCGPVVMKSPAGEWTIPAAGPTTSIREEPYMAGIIERHGVRVIIGKGGMGPKTLEACRRFGCVYLQAVGGAAAVIAQRIVRVQDVWFFDEFGATEAIWKLEVSKLETVVGMDAHGASLFESVRRSSRERLDALLN